jgi:sterol desaturase/sphingolipid hydroxylase (fatty acid hydroxylase superfamily)
MRVGARQGERSVPDLDRSAPLLRRQLNMPAADSAKNAVNPARWATVARVLAWPGLLLSCCAILGAGFARGQETLFFNLSYAWIVCWLLLAERVLGYRDDWHRADGQLRADLAHTVLNKGLVQLFIVSILATGVLERDTPSGIGGWPLAAQVLFGLVASEFGLYWAHRLAHEWPLLWRFHAIHHSVRKLWLVNTGRFHFVDSLESVLFSLPFLLLTGLSMDAIVWVSAITAYIGILTHCNVDMRCAAGIIPSIRRSATTTTVRT